MREKKIRKLSDVTKVQTHVMFVLHNVRMLPSNMRKKKGSIKYDKITTTCDVGTAQCKDSIIKCKKKIKEPLNVTKVQSHVIWYYTI